MKAREMRLRRAADRMGLRLERSRRRSADAIGYRQWCVRSRWDAERVVAWCDGSLALVDAPAKEGGAERWGAWLTLDRIEKFLTQAALWARPNREWSLIAYAVARRHLLSGSDEKLSVNLKGMRMPLSDEEKTVLDLYWKMYNKHATQARHHETLRATISALLVSLVAAILGIKLTMADRQIGWIIVSLSAIGLFLNLKHYERNRLATTRLASFRNEMDAILTRHGGRLNQIHKMARADHRKKYWFLSRVRLHWLWLMIFGVLGLIGLKLVLAI